jgi:5-hydroxyisourate hydrolase
MLTTHALDTAQGRPATGVKWELWRGQALVRSGETDARGRATLLDRTEPGEYEIVWHVGDYFRGRGFLRTVPVRFTVADEGDYHVPLLVSPWSYTTYRGG